MIECARRLVPSCHVAFQPCAPAAGQGLHICSGCPSHPEDLLMRLSVIIPVFNEVSTIDRVVKAVRAVPIEKEIIVVDDASTDGTRRNSVFLSVKAVYESCTTGETKAKEPRYGTDLVTLGMTSFLFRTRTLSTIPRTILDSSNQFSMERPTSSMGRVLLAANRTGCSIFGTRWETSS